MMLCGGDAAAGAVCLQRQLPRHVDRRRLPPPPPPPRAWRRAQDSRARAQVPGSPVCTARAQLERPTAAASAALSHRSCCHHHDVTSTFVTSSSRADAYRSRPAGPAGLTELLPRPAARASAALPRTKDGNEHHHHRKPWSPKDHEAFLKTK